MKPSPKPIKQAKGNPSKIKSVLGLLKSPYGIAVIASVGFHGILFASGPSFSQVSLESLTGSGEGDAAERTVPLVQLSPTEQGRLPDFTTPRLPFNLGSGNPPTRTSRLPNLPVPSGRRTVPPIPSRPNLPSATAPQPSRSGSVRTPFFNSPSIPTFRIPAPSSRPAIILPPRNVPTPSGSGSTPGTQATPPTAAQPTPDSDLQRQLEIEAQEQANQGNPEASTPGTAENLEMPGETPNSNGETENVENPPSDQTGEVAIAPTPEQQSQLARLLEGLVFDETGTDAETATTKRENWITENQSDEVEISVAEAETPTTVDSNIRVCVENPPVDTSIGIIVGPDGLPTEAPEILRSSGYSNLNTELLNAVGSKQFDPTDSVTAYIFNFDVAYDAENCVQTDQLLQTNAE